LFFPSFPTRRSSDLFKSLFNNITRSFDSDLVVSSNWRCSGGRSILSSEKIQPTIHSTPYKYVPMHLKMVYSYLFQFLIFVMGQGDRKSTRLNSSHVS